MKASNALHQYEYLELRNNTVMTDLPLRHHHNYEREEEREWSAVSPSHPPVNIITSSVIMRAESPPPQQQQHEYTMSLSPTMLNSDPIHYSPPPPTFESTTVTLEKTIRPSEYRAKRRSLLIQSPISLNNTRARSSSSFGVGGVLPDEIIQLQKTQTPVDSTFRRSWISSGSSVGYYSGSIDSSAPNSPNSDGQRPYSSISSTLPQGGGNIYQQRQHTRRNSANESSFDECNGIDNDDNRRRSVHKTESGKRKERHLMKQYYNSDNSCNNSNETIISNSSGSKFKRWSLRNELGSSEYQQQQSKK